MNAPDEVLPREFGKYHLIERVATGGMAALYRAKLYGAGGFEKDLAVKKILPQLGQDDDFVQMFMDEAMITVTLSHGNIAQVIDFGEIDGEYYLVMEYVDGVDLQCLLKRCCEDDKPVSAMLAAHIVQEICRGLDYAHNKLGPDGEPLQIIHRDVSPQNVLISFEGQVKLVDFGIARAASRISSTQAGVVKGKVGYMSPEQLTAQPIDGRSDVWAAGVILYELLSLERPFEGGSPQETMARISRGAYKPPQKINKQVDRKLAAVIKKALERNVKKRYATAGKMAQALASYLHSHREPPGAMAVAELVRQRMPEAKPRTLQPTPVRSMRRESTPPEQPRPAAQPEPAQPRAASGASSPPGAAGGPAAFGPASQPPSGRPRKTTEPEFPSAERRSSTEDELEVSGEAPALVDGDGEAISFGALGLPGDYATVGQPPAAASTAAAGGSDDVDSMGLEGYGDEDPTLIEPHRAGLAGSDPDADDEELVRAAERLLTRTEAPELPGDQAAAGDATVIRPQQPEAEAAVETDDDVGDLADYDEDLLQAQTRIKAAGDDQSAAADTWLAAGEPDAAPPDFDDEAPALQRPASSGRWLPALVVLLVAGAAAGAVWALDPFGWAAPADGAGEPAALEPHPGASGPQAGQRPATPEQIGRAHV